MESYDIPPDVILLLRDTETFLAECLQYENLSSRAKEDGEKILNGCWLVQKRYQLETQPSGEPASIRYEGSDDNKSYGVSLVSDEVSLTSDYLDDESTDAEQLEKVLKQGYLEKRNRDHGFFGSEWQKRWCVLTNGSFCYYSTEKGKLPKGGFLIKDCSAHLVSHIRKDSRRDACFELLSPGSRGYQFTASTPAEAREWVDQIQFLVKDTLSTTIPYEDYDDVDSLDPSTLQYQPSPGRAISPEEDDIYESVPGEEESDDLIDVKATNYWINPGGSVINYADYYQGLWNCTSDNNDELSFQRGDLIHILSKEYHTYGWWVGELDGAVGIVPKDYLTVAFYLEGM